MRRREFIAGLGSAAAGWSIAARAQQPERMRRVGMLMVGDSDNVEEQRRLAVFMQALERLGWTAGRNLQLDLRWARAGDFDLMRKHATDLVSASPEVLVTQSQGLAIMRQTSRTLPIVFMLAIDPVGSGDVASMARPGGNATGFLLFEYSIAGKWLDILRQIVPGLTHVAVLRDPATPAGIGQFAAIQAFASPLKVEVIPIDLRDRGDIERGIAAIVREPHSGLIITASVSVVMHADLVSALTARHRLPDVHPFRTRIARGGLISYGPDIVDQYRAGAGYVDRILRGTPPADLPVQAPTKYEMVLNLKTAKALGLTLPTTLLAGADEVIE